MTNKKEKGAQMRARRRYADLESTESKSKYLDNMYKASQKWTSAGAG